MLSKNRILLLIYVGISLQFVLTRLFNLNISLIMLCCEIRNTLLL